MTGRKAVLMVFATFLASSALPQSTAAQGGTGSIVIWTMGQGSMLPGACYSVMESLEDSPIVVPVPIVVCDNLEGDADETPGEVLLVNLESGRYEVRVVSADRVLP